MSAYIGDESGNRDVPEPMRARPHFVLLASLTASLVLARSMPASGVEQTQLANVDAAEPVPVAPAYTTAAGCIAEDAFEQALTERGLSVGRSRDVPRVLVHLSAQADGFQGTLRIQSASGALLLVRELDAPLCAELTSAFAL